MFDWFLKLSLLWQIAIVYLLIINVFTFFTFALDKMKSRGDARRIRERTLWLLSLLGGSPAALVAMNYFRHKTKKMSFQAVIILILAVQVAAIFFLYTFFEKQNPPLF